MKKLFLFSLISFNLSMLSQTPIRYIALGDSYTICTGATEAQSWPVLMSKHLKEKGVNIELIANPSQNGWTSQNLIDRELPVLDKSKATFVTLLIGVNDWVQGVDAKTFQKNLVKIIDHIQTQLPDKSKSIASSLVNVLVYVIFDDISISAVF